MHSILIKLFEKMVSDWKSKPKYENVPLLLGIYTLTHSGVSSTNDQLSLLLDGIYTLTHWGVVCTNDQLSLGRISVKSAVVFRSFQTY